MLIKAKENLNSRRRKTFEVLGCQKLLCDHPSQFCPMQWNSIIYLHKAFHPHKKHDVMASAIVRTTLPLCEPIWGQGNSRRPKESAKEPSLCAHNRSSCKAFGKRVTTKELSGAQSSTGLVSPASHTDGEVGTDTTVKGKGICLGCKLAKTLAVTHGGVWEKRAKKTSPREDVDNTQGLHSKYLKV